ncbi:MAG: lipopolysaccharide heptosyltransferase II [Isosphaeraceae bacterium]
MKIAIFCPNLIGDTVMATPTFRAIRRGFPGAELTAVIKPHVAPTLDGTAWFDHWIHFDPRSRNRGHRSWTALGRLREGRFDLAVLLPNSVRSAGMAWLAGIPRRVGYDNHGRRILLTDRLYQQRDEEGRRLPVPIVETYLKLARLLGCPVDSIRLELATTPDDEAAADQAFGALGWSPDEIVVCLNTGGAFGPAKNWPTTHFAVLARRLADELGVHILVLCGPSERDAAREIVRSAAHPMVASLADQKLGIGLTKACVSRASLLITTDSGPRHFAAAFDTPVLTLFGPTHIAWTRTHHGLAWHVFHPVPCGPCQRPVCPEGHHRCMRELTPDSVFRAACRLLAPSRC